ncbi:MAG: chorismate-binding protein, partial [Pirellulaceae bacterium]|nr:chorismate-binding protein [Pirellulaceae bacterium]
MSDTLTPVSAFHKLDQGGEACLFESVIGGEKVGRYSFLAFHPVLEISAQRDKVTLRYVDPASPHVASSSQSFEQFFSENERAEKVRSFDAKNPLESLRNFIAQVQVAPLESLPPFSGGMIGYAGYDTIRYTENLPNAPHDDRQLPDMTFSLYEYVLVFDNVNKTLMVILMTGIQELLQAIDDEADPLSLIEENAVPYVTSEYQPESLLRNYSLACKKIEAILGRLREAGDLEVSNFIDHGLSLPPYTSNTTQENFEKAVGRCIEYIEAGDIFQVVIGQRLEVEVSSDSFEVYRTLRVVNPSPFMFYLRTKKTTLVGSSPEIMCRVAENIVTVRPLAGTRKRGRTEAEDEALEKELLADPKERAEHVMLVDLGRNDVGRVAKFGTVELSEMMTVERYSHVMHISSNVRGELKEGLDAFDALQASIPAGTVSGAPKVRAMEIIDELETTRRGPYAGAVGYVDFSGNMDTCI